MCQVSGSVVRKNCVDQRDFGEKSLRLKKKRPCKGYRGKSMFQLKVVDVRSRCSMPGNAPWKARSYCSTTKTPCLQVTSALLDVLEQIRRVAGRETLTITTAIVCSREDKLHPCNLMRYTATLGGKSPGNRWDEQLPKSPPC